MANSPSQMMMGVHPAPSPVMYGGPSGTLPMYAVPVPVSHTEVVHTTKKKTSINCCCCGVPICCGKTVCIILISVVVVVAVGVGVAGAYYGGYQNGKDACDCNKPPTGTTTTTTTNTTKIDKCKNQVAFCTAKQGTPNTFYLAFTGGSELNNIGQLELGQAAAAVAGALNVDPSYTAASVCPSVATTKSGSVVLKVEVYPTATVTSTALQDSINKNNVVNFFRNQAETICWWKGIMCGSDASGTCTTATVTPPKIIQGCDIDICYSMDGSGSISSSPGAWDMETALVGSAVTSVGADSSNLVVYRFSDTVDEIVKPTTRGAALANSGMLTSIQQTPAAGGSTDMATAITQCKTALDGMRKGKNKVMVLLTDGQPDDLDATIKAADELKGAGMRLVSIGVGGAAFDTLLQLSSGQGYTFNATDITLTNVQKLADDAAQAACT